MVGRDNLFKNFGDSKQGYSEYEIFLIQPLNCILLTGRDKLSFGCNHSLFDHKFEHILT